MDLIIEKAKPADAEAILEFTRIVGAETDNLSYGAEGIGFSTEQEIAHIESLENSETGIFLVAKDGNEIVGTASFQTYPKKRVAHRGVFGISVKKDHWNRGVGTKLTEKALEFAKNTAHAKIVSLEVRSDNLAAIHLYEKFGFQKIGTFKGFFLIEGEMVDLDIMELFF